MNGVIKFVRSRPDWQLLSIAVILLLMVKAWLINIAGYELHFDEAQYWEWSQQLDWSYYSKGPLIAWLIALSQALFGKGDWQVRLFGWIAHGVFLVLMFLFARHVWNNRAAGWWAFTITALTPLYFTLGQVMTTDNLLLMFWTWGLWAAYRALIDEQPQAWYQAGAAVGLGALTKLSIGLLPAFIGILVMLRPAWWHQLKSPHLWSSLALMLVCMSPLLLWNATHDWVMFRHELGHVEPTGWSITRGLEFIASQFLALSPFVVIVAISVLYHPPKKQNLVFLWLLSLSWIGFFVFKSISGKEEINWAAPGYISLIVLFAGHITTLDQWRKSLLYFGMACSIMLVAILFFPNTIGLSAKDVPTLRKMTGWREQVLEISKQAPNVDFIFTTSYPLAAQMAYSWPSPVNVYIAGSAGRRFNQHDLWPSINREAGHTGLYVASSAEWPADLQRAFEKCTRLQPVDAKDRYGTIVRILYPTVCENYQVIVWPIPQGY
jgi:4-amino-4-deoxy-L-arabinose transferase-like glycosyltransferase